MVFIIMDTIFEENKGKRGSSFERPETLGRIELDYLLKTSRLIYSVF